MPECILANSPRLAIGLNRDCHILLAGRLRALRQIGALVDVGDIESAVQRFKTSAGLPTDRPIS